MLQSVAGKIQLQNDAVVHQVINGNCRRHGILEDTLPFGKGQITGDPQTASFVAYPPRLVASEERIPPEGAPGVHARS